MNVKVSKLMLIIYALHLKTDKSLYKQTPGKLFYYHIEKPADDDAAGFIKTL